ncbi:MAG: glycosyltransferase family 2 protein [Bacilli bacterium]|nr:glycosyltransferase family 2 protein [Bacilli bacterium]
MIVKDEEDNISKCLKSCYKLFDEIIIVDTGSTDKTKKIVKKYTNIIYNFKWVDDFSAARNYAFSFATMDYIMWLDTDDILKEEDYQKLKKLKQTMNNEYDIIMLKYNIAFDESGMQTFSYYRERLLKRSKNYKWNDRVHEYIELSGNLKREDIAITHDKKTIEKSNRNLNIYKQMILKKEDFTPRNLYYYGRELYEHGDYEETVKVLTKFIKTKKGWVEDNINTCYLLSNCYNLLNKLDDSKIYLYKTFNYDIPRKKTTCLIGNIFLNNQEYSKAIYWYNLSLTLKSNKESGFYESDYDYFIPYINLCVAYDKVGDDNKALKYHELSKLVKPDNELVKYNDVYFKQR